MPPSAIRLLEDIANMSLLELKSQKKPPCSFTNCSIEPKMGRPKTMLVHSIHQIAKMYNLPFDSRHVQFTALAKKLTQQTADKSSFRTSSSNKHQGMRREGILLAQSKSRNAVLERLISTSRNYHSSNQSLPSRTFLTSREKLLQSNRLNNKKFIVNRRKLKNATLEPSLAPFNLKMAYSLNTKQTNYEDNSFIEGINSPHLQSQKDRLKTHEVSQLLMKQNQDPSRLAHFKVKLNTELERTKSTSQYSTSGSISMCLNSYPNLSLHPIEVSNIKSKMIASTGSKLDSVQEHTLPHSLKRRKIKPYHQKNTSIIDSSLSKDETNQETGCLEIIFKCEEMTSNAELERVSDLIDKSHRIEEQWFQLHKKIKAAEVKQDMSDSEDSQSDYLQEEKTQWLNCIFRRKRNNNLKVC